METLNRIRKVLWAEGSSYISPILGLITFIVFCVAPWIIGTRGAMTLVQHYFDFGRTWESLGLMIRLGQPDAAIAFSIALILLPFAFWWAFRNRPAISGLLYMVSGLLLIYMYEVTAASITLDYVGVIWGGSYSFFSPYRLGISVYAIILMGILLTFTHYYFKRKEP